VAPTYRLDQQYLSQQQQHPAEWPGNTDDSPRGQLE
jgi:hypothetical protein